MAVTLYEQMKSQGFTKDADSASTPRKFLAMGSNARADIYAALILGCPYLDSGYKRQSVAAEPLGAGLWDCTVTYGTGANGAPDTDDTPSEPGGENLGPESAFDCSASQTHITQSLLTRYRYTAADTAGAVAAPGTGPNYKRAIGVTKDRVEGVDIYTPKFEFSYTVQMTITKTYLNKLKSLVAKTNNADWWWFKAGEVLYLGCSGQCGPDGLFKITHKFSAGTNLTDVQVSDDITIPVKKAWDYIWCTYKASVNAGQVVQTPAAAYVEKVYREDSFSTILGF